MKLPCNNLLYMKNTLSIMVTQKETILSWIKARDMTLDQLQLATRINRITLRGRLSELVKENRILHEGKLYKFNRNIYNLQSTV
jgi:hypothetical protein